MKVESTRTAEVTLNVSELFFGTYARLYSFSCAIVLLIVILVMSIRLFASRRRKAYFSLTVSVAAIVVHYALLVAMALAGDASPGWTDFAAQVLKVVSFIMINRAIYQLYNSTTKRVHLYFYLSLFATFLFALIRIHVPRWFGGTAEQIEALKQIGFDLYLLLLIFACFLAIPATIAQARKYKFGLLVYLIVHLAYLLNTYILETPLTALAFVELYLPLLYYFILFMLLFERIVELMQAIYRSSITDGLTGLYNRRYFTRRAAQFVDLGYPAAVLFSDIDNFKKLNDTRGHQAGDEALRAVAQILLEESEEVGIAGRFGGEEMVVLVTDPAVDMAEFAERIRRRVETETDVTVSIGYSKSRKGTSAEQLIKQADQAMYAAKTSGKNKVVKYAAHMAAAMK